MKRSFGSTLRAIRLGWGLVEKHGCNIRICTDGDKNIIELCPVNDIPSIREPSRRGHRVWWEHPEILDGLPWLAPIRQVKKYIKVEVDNNGEIIVR